MLKADYSLLQSKITTYVFSGVFFLLLRRTRISLLPKQFHINYVSPQNGYMVFKQKKSLHILFNIVICLTLCNVFAFEYSLQVCNVYFPFYVLVRKVNIPPKCKMSLIYIKCYSFEGFQILTQLMEFCEIHTLKVCFKIQSISKCLLIKMKNYPVHFYAKMTVVGQFRIYIMCTRVQTSALKYENTNVQKKIMQI